MHDREESAVTGTSIQECILSPFVCRHHKFCCLPREFCWSARVLGVRAAAEGCLVLAGTSPARPCRSVLASTPARRGRFGHPQEESNGSEELAPALPAGAARASIAHPHWYVGVDAMSWRSLEPISRLTGVLCRVKFFACVWRRSPWVG